MKIRQLTFDDCEAVADLEIQLFDGRFDAAGLRKLLGKPAFFGAVLLDRHTPTIIHAYCLAFITFTEADIIAIGTEKTHQGLGFGKIILQYLIVVTEQHNVAKIALEVAADNIPARRLYDSCGFHISGIRKDYYNRGEDRCDAMIMVRCRDSAFP